jgi:branched-chain amino acid transport system substrate-binding protein
MKTKFKLTQPSDIILPSGVANSYDAGYLIAEALKIAGDFDRRKLRDAFFKVRYQGLIANYNPAFEPTVERHDAILPTHCKLLVVHKGYLMPVEQTPYTLKK